MSGQEADDLAQGDAAGAVAAYLVIEPRNAVSTHLGCTPKFLQSLDFLTRLDYNRDGLDDI